jgi:cytidine deaminase
LKRLATRIAQSKGETNVNDSLAEAQNLLMRDEIEESNPYGQDVRGTFPLADVFVNANNPESLVAQIQRFAHILFADPFITPTKAEYGMFHAKAAALRSADLSRQVGAAITSREGDILAVGCNEVPKYDGGLYWEGDSPDGRDFTTGRNVNRDTRENMISEALTTLKKNKWLAAEKEAMSIETLKAEAVMQLANTRLNDIGEFGRTVHAEMEAIVSAARRGTSVRGGTIYTTTFPCHMCAKHIVAAGIKRVVYIEPYPKSLTPVLHSDTVAVDSADPVADKVQFCPFIGIAPRFYTQAFTAPKRRRNGDPLPVGQVADEPRYSAPLYVYGLMEDMLEKELDTALKEKEGKNGG